MTTAFGLAINELARTVYAFLFYLNDTNNNHNKTSIIENKNEATMFSDKNSLGIHCLRPTHGLQLKVR
jgi:hypothetical protein